MKETSEAMIDIVLPWVDGSDPAWRALRNKYMGESEGDSSEERYRDWGLLKYVFRGIEKNLLDNTGKGLPYIARVPVLRALFGNTRRERSLRKLSIFILPTVIE